MIFLSALGTLWILWVFFTAAMRLKMVRNERKLTIGMKCLGYPTIAIGLFIDLVVQILATVPFLELPREWTLSARLWRLSNGPAGWRAKLAIFVRTQFLDAIDPNGIHTG